MTNESKVIDELVLLLPENKKTEWNGLDLCKYSRITCKMRNGYRAIVKLNLKGLGLPALPTPFKLDYLEELDASYNELASIPILLTPSLKKLNLSHNQLGDHPQEQRDMAECNKDAYTTPNTFIDVSYNQLNVLPVFSSAEDTVCMRIGKIKFSHNKLYEISVETWEKFFSIHDTIEALNFDDNRLETLPLPKESRTLKQVSARNNDLKDITEALSNLSNLSSLALDLRGNPFLRGKVPEDWCKAIIINRIRFDGTADLDACSGGTRFKNFFKNLFSIASSVASYVR